MASKILNFPDPERGEQLEMTFELLSVKDFLSVKDLLNAKKSLAEWSVPSKNYAMYVHPDQYEVLMDFLNAPEPIDILKKYGTLKTDTGGYNDGTTDVESPVADYLLDNAPTGSDFL